MRIFFNLRGFADVADWLGRGLDLDHATVGRLRVFEFERFAVKLLLGVEPAIGVARALIFHLHHDGDFGLERVADAVQEDAQRCVKRALRRCAAAVANIARGLQEVAEENAFRHTWGFTRKARRGFAKCLSRLSACGARSLLQLFATLTVLQGSNA